MEESNENKIMVEAYERSDKLKWKDENEKNNWAQGYIAAATKYEQMLEEKDRKIESLEKMLKDSYKQNQLPNI